MNITDVLAFRRRSDKHSRFKEMDHLGFQMYTKQGLHRVELVDDELTTQLNKKFGCRTRFLVIKAHQYGYTRYNPVHHIIYHLSPSKEFMYITRMILKNERYLVPRFKAETFKSGRYSYTVNDVDRFPDDAAMIRKVHRVMKELLLESPHYRLLYVTGGIS